MQKYNKLLHFLNEKKYFKQIFVNFHCINVMQYKHA